MASSVITSTGTLLVKGCQRPEGTRPHVFITDKLGSYAAAHKDVMPSVEHRSHKRLNNRAENSHQPPRQRERGYPLGVAALHVPRPGPTFPVCLRINPRAPDSVIPYVP